MKIAQLFAGMALALAGCTPGAAERPVSPPGASVARHPVSGLEVAPLTVRSGGKVHRFRVELARTSAEPGRGLMFRARMGADEGMLFPLDRPRMAAFWMKNTVIPLDIIFIGPDRRILNIAADTLVGAIPVVGFLFDLGFKANQRNLNLLRQHLAENHR